MFLAKWRTLGVRPVGVGSGGQSSWRDRTGMNHLVKGAEHPTPVGAVPIRRELNAVPTLQAYAGGGRFRTTLCMRKKTRKLVGTAFSFFQQSLVSMARSSTPLPDGPRLLLTNRRFLPM